MARSADKGHIGDVEGRRRNSIAHVDPKPAKRRRVTLRFGATSEVFAEQGEGSTREMERTMVRNPTHRDDSQCLKGDRQ